MEYNLITSNSFFKKSDYIIQVTYNQLLPSSDLNLKKYMQLYFRQAALMAILCILCRKKMVRIKKWKPNVQKGKTQKYENLIQK